jgi:hypothetical protein
MSQDDGIKKDDVKTSFEKAVGQVEERLEIDTDQVEDNPPKRGSKLSEDNPPLQNNDNRAGDKPPPSEHHWNGWAIAALIIAGILILLGITCFVAISNIQ